MKQVRIGVFETNSSSTHSLVVCTKEEYDKWKAEELFYLQDVYSLPKELKEEFQNKDFITEDEKNKLLENGLDEYDVKSFEDWNTEYEEDVNRYTTKSGEELVIRCCYGHD